MPFFQFEKIILILILFSKGLKEAAGPVLCAEKYHTW